MQIFRKIADYSFGQADIIRKAMSKKKAGVIEKERESFLDGAVRKGVSREAAEELFDELVGFCKYAFNKSHAASYALVTYRTAYLKCHYPREYMAALLTSVIGYEDKIVLYAEECKRLGIRLLPPDINESYGYFNPVGGNIRFALLALKNVGRTFVDDIVNERIGGNFVSFEDFLNRMREKDLNKRQIEALIKVGCFDNMGLFRSQLLSVFEEMIESFAENNRKNASGQLDFFSVDTESDSRPDSGFKYPSIPELEPKEMLIYERECAGFCFSGNILDGFSLHEKDVGSVSIKDVIEAFDSEEGDETIEGTGRFRDRQRITVCGIITKLTDKTTRKGDKILFVNLEDRSRQMEVIVFSSVLEEYGYMLTVDNVVAVKGDISARGDNGVKLVMQSAEVLVPNDRYVPKRSAPQPQTRPTPAPPKEKVLYLKVDNMECLAFKKAVNLLEIFEGNTKVVFFDASTGNYVAANGRSVDVSGGILGFFVQLLGKENVILK